MISYPAGDTSWGYPLLPSILPPHPPTTPPTAKMANFPTGIERMSLEANDPIPWCEAIFREYLRPSTKDQYWFENHMQYDSIDEYMEMRWQQLECDRADLPGQDKMEEVIRESGLGLKRRFLEAGLGTEEERRRRRGKEKRLERKMKLARQIRKEEEGVRTIGDGFRSEELEEDTEWEEDEMDWEEDSAT